MEPLTGAARAAMFVSPADAKVALPPILWGLEAGTLLALAALLVALVPLVIVLRGGDGARCAAAARRILALVQWPAVRIRAPKVVWSAAEIAGRGRPSEATASDEGLVAASRTRALSDRG
jgi:hypothetical protein